ncbi:MAG: 3-deoxy-manno-octulosonate cytidylyltransferase [Oligoflexia bacterium]|nr:3-deoxy-manno-octulosonate cytidylyltransferase [Oligoflexia bacterium]
MNVIGVIPSRYGSTRFPAKALALIAGTPLIGHVIKGAKKCKKLSQLIVATDHNDIASVATEFGAKVVMTESDLPSGSDRVWAAAKNINCDVVINIQGDEPLVNQEPLDLLCDAFIKNPLTQMATLARPIKSQDELNNPNVAKIIIDNQARALYFSRLAIPFSRQPWGGRGDQGLKHIGLYAYKKEVLGRFCAQKPTKLEQAEGLEQLRALWLGIDIQVILTNFESWGVDQPEDVVQIERILASSK